MVFETNLLRWVSYACLLVLGACGMMWFHYGVKDGEIGTALFGAMLTYGSYTHIGTIRERSRH